MRYARPTISYSHNPVERDGAFTLIELLIVVSIMALLLSILLPGLGKAREQAKAAVCASNVRQLLIANNAYASEYGGRYCAGAVDMATENLQRWHGMRSATDEDFDPARGPLSPFLGESTPIRQCPSFPRFIASTPAAFESGSGGYGYNQAYLGRVMKKFADGNYAVVTDDVGELSERIRRPAETLMFSDAAFAAKMEGVIEYSFAEPRFHPEWLAWQARTDPSIHFRHTRQANIGWCDGHVDRRTRKLTWCSGLYPGDPDRQELGWFGANDDNGLFDLD